MAPFTMGLIGRSMQASSLNTADACIPFNTPLLEPSTWLPSSGFTNHHGVREEEVEEEEK